MLWYRAEIKGEGFYIDGGVTLSERKVVIWEFEASSDEEAEEKAKTFAHSPEIRREYWMTGSPNVAVTKFIGRNQPTKERHYLV